MAEQRGGDCGEKSQSALEKSQTNLQATVLPLRPSWASTLMGRHPVPASNASSLTLHARVGQMLQRSGRAEAWLGGGSINRPRPLLGGHLEAPLPLQGCCPMEGRCSLLDRVREPEAQPPCPIFFQTQSPSGRSHCLYEKSLRCVSLRGSGPETHRQAKQTSAKPGYHA